MDYICNTADRLELGCLTEFQGGLKQRTAEDIDKIKKSIHRHGFAFPFFVWSHGGVNHVLDGHGRIQALKQIMNNVWHFERTSKQEREGTGGHTTPKPIALCARAIKSSSRPGEIVLDFFGGSGSTLIACEQTDRRCYMCELEQCYIDVIIQRWEILTGEKAELLERVE